MFLHNAFLLHIHLQQARALKQKATGREAEQWVLENATIMEPASAKKTFLSHHNDREDTSLWTGAQSNLVVDVASMRASYKFKVDVYENMRYQNRMKNFFEYKKYFRIHNWFNGLGGRRREELKEIISIMFG